MEDKDALVISTLFSVQAQIGSTEAKTAAILRKLDDQDTELAEIKIQTQKTNGRVSALERWRSYIAGAFGVISFAIYLVYHVHA